MFSNSLNCYTCCIPCCRLPYGEFLGEIEALHLIIAHDLYNELKSLVEELQRLGLCELPVNLLVMMVAFFRGHPRLLEPGKVLRIHHYYMNTLKVSQLHKGGTVVYGLMNHEAGNSNVYCGFH